MFDIQIEKLTEGFSRRIDILYQKLMEKNLIKNQPHVDFNNGAGDGIRTHSLLVTSQLLYRWSYSSIEIEAKLLFFSTFVSQ